MDAIVHATNTVLGLSLNPDDLGAGQMALRAVLVYVAGLIIVRLAKKRFMGRHSAFDSVLLVILGSVLSRAINGTAAFFETLGASLVLVGAHWVTGYAAYHSHRFGDAVKGYESELVRDGVVDETRMRKHHISEHDLDEALRLQGNTTQLSDVATAHLERSGDISVITRRRDPRVVDVAVAPGTQTVRIQLE
jgi:uncharacterized membrane protein YcaP (DUF421 family)